MRPGETHEVGTPGHEDRVHMVGLIDVADRHGRHAGLIADAVRERGLEHAAIDWLSLDRRLTGRHVADIDPGLLQEPADLDRLARFYAFAADPVIRGNAYGDRFLGGPYRTDRMENLQRIAHAVFQRAAILVGAPIGQRRYE